MFSFAIILAIASTTFELMIAAKIPVWRRLSHKSIVFNLVNSMVISWITGMMFGAAGLIAMTAGILSTLMSIPGYALLNWMYDSPKAQANGGDLYKHYKGRYNAKKDKVKQTIADFFTLIYKIMRIVTFPIWGTRALMLKINNLRARFAS